MSAAFQRPMTIEEFLAWEERQAIRYEFDGTRAVAMAGGSLAHAAIATNLTAALVTSLRGKPCRAYNGDVKVIVAGRSRYPDASVTCSEQPVADRRRQGVVHEPVVVFEVLSSATSVRDRTEKNAEYRATTSIRRYVMLEQERVAATVFERAGDDWVGHLLLGAESTLALPEIGVPDIRLVDLYEGVAFADPEPDAVPPA